MDKFRQQRSSWRDGRNPQGDAREPHDSRDSLEEDEKEDRRTPDVRSSEAQRRQMPDGRRRASVEGYETRDTPESQSEARQPQAGPPHIRRPQGERHSSHARDKRGFPSVSPEKKRGFPTQRMQAPGFGSEQPGVYRPRGESTSFGGAERRLIHAAVDEEFTVTSQRPARGAQEGGRVGCERVRHRVLVAWSVPSVSSSSSSHGQVRVVGPSPQIANETFSPAQKEPARGLVPLSPSRVPWRCGGDGLPTLQFQLWLELQAVACAESIQTPPFDRRDRYLGGLIHRDSR